MIVEYHRPTSISDALILLARKQPLTFPLGGGTVLNRGVDGQIAVVDLQALGLGKISKKGNLLQIGATVTLQGLMEIEGLPGNIYKAIEKEATYNLRQMATIAGTLVTASGRSLLATTLLAMDASIELHELDVKSCQMKLGDWLPIRRETTPGKLITMVSIPLNIHFAYEYISRSPADLPIVCVAIVQWDSGRTRLALGGWGTIPVLAMDGPDSAGIEFAGKNAYSIAGDEWASAEYRQEMAGILSRRCMNQINSG